MVKGRDQRHTPLSRDLPADGVTVLRVAVVQNHLTTCLTFLIAPGGCQFGDRCIMRHHDHARHTEHARRQSDGLRMIARGIRNHAGSSLQIAQFGQGIETASELKSSHALKVLTLHKNLCLQSIIQSTRPKNGRLECDAFKP
jgi:hypothetical protein